MTSSTATPDQATHDETNKQPTQGKWQQRPRPTRLEGRYEFQTYTQLRDFLDQAAELSEQMDLYPDMGFGKNYVNITLHTEQGSETITQAQQQYADKLDALREQID